ncbi:sacsin-like [Mercenaria mercenaria]|uniref:sacsin-like n=1 Tax=Mercenaria mercenaria TaxID=6596 RepID=UPI00234F5622|nr:sacsin-like [Mercenaria mercenaria]
MKQNEIAQNILQSVMKEIYEDLYTYVNCGELDKTKGRQLEKYPIIYIPEIKQMVLASTIVINCRDEEEIHPFLNKCPDIYIQYKQLFLLLGAMKEVSCDAYASVLFSLSKVCRSSSLLLPQEKSDAIKAMVYFFKFLTQQPHEANINKNHTFMLSENFTLEDARNLIVKNNPYFQKQLEKASNLPCLFLIGFEKLQGQNLKKENCIDGLQLLPIRNRPYLLTDIVREHVVLENIVFKDGRVSRQLDYFIHSSRFIHGFLRLIRHSWRTEGRMWTSTEEVRLVNHLGNITFRHATGIETLLAIRPVENGILLNEQLVENTNEARNVHLEQNENNICVFFDSIDDTWFEDVKTKLTVHLNGIVDKCLKDQNLMRLREIIGMKDSPDRIGWYLSKEKIEEYGSPVDIQEAVSYPKPGTFVPKELYPFLDNSYGEIHEYEYKFVALEIEDPAFDDYTEGDTAEDIETDLDPTYIFVHVVRQVDSDVKIPLFQEYEIDDGTENLHIVKAYQLFKFIRKKIKQTEKKKHSEKKELDVETQLMIYVRNKPEDEVKDHLKSQSLKATFSEIKLCLQKAWKQPEVQKRKIVKRLLLMWHPDKNHGNELFCTKVFQYIQQCIRRLENGLNLIDTDEDESGRSSDRNSDSRSSEDFWSSSWFGRFWERHETGRQYHEQRYRNRSYDEFDGGWNARGTFFAEPESKPFHYHAEARRWLKQAKSDLDNSTLSLQRKPNNSFNWVCYMAHQAAEKSMKAAWYAKDANKIHTVRYSHNLNSIASGLGSGIESLARSLTSLTGEHTRMRYPDAFCGQRVPEEAFNRQIAETVVSVAKQIIDTVQSNYIR